MERYFQSSTFRKDWIDRRTRLIPAWRADILVLQGSDEPPMPVENYAGLDEYLPDVTVELVDGGHFFLRGRKSGWYPGKGAAVFARGVGKPLPSFVMPALVAGIHVYQYLSDRARLTDVDGRNKSGHDVDRDGHDD